MNKEKQIEALFNIIKTILDADEIHITSNTTTHKDRNDITFTKTFTDIAISCIRTVSTSKENADRTPYA